MLLLWVDELKDADQFRTYYDATGGYSWRDVADYSVLGGVPPNPTVKTSDDTHLHSIYCSYTETPSEQWNNVNVWNTTLTNNTFTWRNVNVWNTTLTNGTWNWEGNNIDVWNITLVNGTFTWNNVTTWNTTLSNTSIEEWQNANIWNITLVNGTFIWNNVTTWNTTLSNLTEEWVNINIWNITLSNLTTYNNINIWNTTLVNSSIDLITVTNEFPDNQSINIPLQPTMYLTINHTEGETMNISWYYGTQGNENTLLGTDVNFTNSTQSELNWNASNRVTDYYWRVMINDGTNYVNYSFEFQTEGYNPGINMDRGIWMIFAIMFIIPIALLFMGIKKKKNDEGEY